MKHATQISEQHEVFVVEGMGESATWTRVGTAWPHKDGDGFSVNLKALPLNGWVVIRKPDAEKSMAI